MTGKPANGDRRVAWTLRGLLSAVLLLDIGLPLVYAVQGPATVLNCLYLGFFAAQVGFHAALVVLMRAWFWARVCSVPLLALLEIWYMRGHQPESEIDFFAQIFAMQWFVVAALMVCAIALGFRLHRNPRPELDEDAELPGAQFSLRGMVKFVTVACLVVGVGVRIEWRSISDPVAAILAGLFIVETVLLIPSVLVPRRWVLFAILALAVGFGLGTALFLWLVANWVAWLIFIVPGVLQAAVLILLRLAGYRLRWLRLPAGGRPTVGTPAVESATG